MRRAASPLDTTLTRTVHRILLGLVILVSVLLLILWRSDNPRLERLRMSLADTYIAKLFSVPGGPEQGRWGSKAEREWRAVVELDPEQWEAQFAVANSLSYYPDVMGRTGEAIEGLERARELQEQLEPSKHHVQTYLSLSQLYLRSSKNDRAREALEAGLRYHPGNDQLMAALIQLEGR